jgi:hypothetical protein
MPSVRHNIMLHRQWITIVQYSTVQKSVRLIGYILNRIKVCKEELNQD